VSGCTGGPSVRSGGQASRFDTVRVSDAPSDLPEGEAEVIADARGDLVAVWMHGSPANQARVTLLGTRSRDGGRTFAPAEPVAEDLLLVDPTLALDAEGDVVLGALRKNSVLDYSDVDVVAFRDAGDRWRGPVLLNAEGVFNDRPWLARRADGGLLAVFGRRTPLADGNFDRPVFAVDVPDGAGAAAPRKRLLNRPDQRAPGTAGGSPRTVVLAGDRLVVGYQEIPADNAARLGSGTYQSAAGVLVSEDGGQTFGPSLSFTGASSPVADAGDDEMGGGPTGFTQPFPRLGTDGSAVVAVWIGPAGPGRSSVYCAALAPGATAFTSSQPVQTARTEALTLPTVAVDGRAQGHVFWMERGRGGQWALQYAASGRDCSDFSDPEEVSDVRFPLQQWPGDFMGATISGTDLVVAWAAAGGDDRGVYVSVGRGLAQER